MVQQARLKTARAKLPQVASLRRAGVNTACWQRVAGNPAMTYGEDTVGVADSVLDRQRATAAVAASAPGGGKQKVADSLSQWM